MAPCIKCLLCKSKTNTQSTHCPKYACNLSPESARDRIRSSFAYYQFSSGSMRVLTSKEQGRSDFVNGLGAVRVCEYEGSQWGPGGTKRDDWKVEHFRAR